MHPGPSLRYALATPEAIYGTILFTAVLAAATAEDLAGELFFKGILASIAIWAAHVVAVTVATHGARGSEISGVRQSVRRALDHSAGILLGPVLPLLILALGGLNLIDDMVSYLAALACAVLILGVLGYLALAERQARWYLCLTGAVLTGLAGLVSATLKAMFAE